VVFYGSPARVKPRPPVPTAPTTGGGNTTGNPGSGGNTPAPAEMATGNAGGNAVGAGGNVVGAGGKRGRRGRRRDRRLDGAPEETAVGMVVKQRVRQAATRRKTSESVPQHAARTASAPLISSRASLTIAAVGSAKFGPDATFNGRGQVSRAIWKVSRLFRRRQRAPAKGCSSSRAKAAEPRT